MKAAFYKGNEKIAVGDGLVEAPADSQVQVRIAYAGICGTDMHIYHGKMDKRVNIPQIMGHEVSGTVENVGNSVTHVKPGQPVTVMPLDWCGECPACKAGHTHICQNLKFLGIDTQGGFQELWTVPARAVLPLPEGTSLEKAALIEPLAVACHDVRLAEITSGDKVVVIGGGPIGALIALVAKSAGAEVVVAEINPFRLKLLEGLGLKVVNSKENDLEAYVNDWTRNAGADVVFEVTAHPSGIETAVKLPRTRGKVIVVGIFSDPPQVDLFRFFWRELKLIGARVYEQEDFEKAIKLIAEDVLPLEKLISEVYPLEKLRDGLELMEKGGEVMKILIQCNNQ